MRWGLVAVGIALRVVLEVLAGLILVAGWYVCFVRYNRRRAAEILVWIRAAFSPYAQLLNIQWTSASEFHVCLRLIASEFQQPRIVVRLLPREFIFNWLYSLCKKQQDVAIFQADLEVPPAFNLEVHNQRWWAGSRRSSKFDPNRSHLETFGPFVLTTRRDWQREITSMMDALVASRDSNFISVSFHRTSPHLAATVPLNSLNPQSSDSGNMFETLRELADCAGASRF